MSVRVVVFTTSTPLTIATKKDIQNTKWTFEKKKINFEEYDVSFEEKRREEMKAKSGSDALPQIWINENYIGGYAELESLDEREELDKLLKGTPV
eukprot:TRINITY_DN6699_c0_g1_i1.p1 TRINITY_DN6699_c0_g1~~TRINITY_DN6699_c0_g1_i1.p1  ORF type:complete len:110 (-),score=45.46 TRINITY_DN6699_c0_g1_i1:204-488(-)